MKTKRKLFVLVLILCSILPANAQKHKFYTGLKAGLAIPNLTAGTKSTPLSENYSSKLGSYGGIVGELQTSKILSIRAEINYSSQGGKRDGMQALPLPPALEQLWQMLPQFGITPDNYMYVDIKSKAILNYLEIPVMAKFTFSLGSRINFYMQAGPYMGIMLNAKNITSGSSSVYYKDSNGIFPIDAILSDEMKIGELPFDHTENITSDIHRFNVGGQGAVGFELNMDSGKFFIEGGGNYGFMPIQKDEANGTNNTGAGTVTFGYLFQL